MILYKYKQISPFDPKDTSEEVQRKEVERDRLTQIFIDNKIYFSYPEQLNDPFEFKPRFKIPKDHNIKKEIIRNHLRKFEINIRPLNRRERMIQEKRLLKELKKEDFLNQRYREDDLSCQLWTHASQAVAVLRLKFFKNTAGAK